MNCRKNLNVVKNEIHKIRRKGKTFKKTEGFKRRMEWNVGTKLNVINNEMSHDLNVGKNKMFKRVKRSKNITLYRTKYLKIQNLNNKYETSKKTKRQKDEYTKLCNNN